MTDRTLGRGTPRRHRWLLGAVLVALAGLAPGIASAADRPATPSTLASVWSSAQAGDRILLASGDYGRFSGGTKSGTVTIAEAPGATATISIQFNGARNIRLDGLTLADLTLLGTTRDITVANSRFTGMATVRAESMVNANILFDNNTHANVDVCNNCYEGRLEVTGRGPGPSGVTVQNSTFGPGGNSDGMQIGATGVQVLNNEFVGIKQIGAVHTDSLQLYGQSNTVIRGNYFHDFDVGIMAPDGGNSELITDNVFVGGSYRPAVQLGSQQRSQFLHNTVKNLDVYMDRKAENPGSPSRNSVIRDNVFVNGGIGGYSTSESYCSNCTFSYNLFSSGSLLDGLNSLIGLALFNGGPNPTTYAGFALASGSPGKGEASDGTDLGIRVSGAPAPTPSATPTPSPTPTPTPSATPTATPTPSPTPTSTPSPTPTSSPTPTPTPSPTPTPDTPAQAIWTAPTGVRTGTAVTLDGSASQGNAPRTCTWSFENEDGSTVWESITGCTIQKTFLNADTKFVSLRVVDKDGDVDVDRKSFAVTSPSASTPTPTATPTPTPDLPATAIWTAPTGAMTGAAVTLDGTASDGDAPLSCTWSFENQDGSSVRETVTGCEIEHTFRIVGTKYVRLRVIDRDGDSDTDRQSFAVSGSTRQWALGN